MSFETVEQMIKESGAMWLATADRSETGSCPVIVTESPDRAIYLERREKYQGDLAHLDGWLMIQQPLFAGDAAAFYAAFGSQWPVWLKAQIDINGVPHKIRGFIKNGRKEDWTISIQV